MVNRRRNSSFRRRFCFPAVFKGDERLILMRDSVLYFPSPLGEILLTCDEVGLTGVSFQDGSHSTEQTDCFREENAVLREAKRWLDIYFSGRDPDFTLPLHLVGTPFQQTVWSLLLRIPYGETTTYGVLAKRIARDRGTGCVSAQAVGGAIGLNPIPIFVPCHRVVGAGGRLSGYSGGSDRKRKLLVLEGTDATRLT